jgi:archaeal type IV pilus assembly protein PilA
MPSVHHDQEIGMKEHKKTIHDQAVSPVIGVLLMLVVTIIIAAVVSGFAGGLTGGAKTAPTASIDVKIKALENYGGMPPWGDGYYCPGITIEHLSGDALPTKDLQIITYITNPTSGEIVKGGLNGEKSVKGNASWTMSGWLDSKYCGVLFLNDQNRFGTDTVQDSANGNDNWFGNSSAIFRPGDILCDPHSFAGNYNDNDGPNHPHINPAMDKLFGIACSNTSQGFVPGAVVDFKILDKPSGKYIFDKKVVIQ